MSAGAWRAVISKVKLGKSPRHDESPARGRRFRPRRKRGLGGRGSDGIAITCIGIG